MHRSSSVWAGLNLRTLTPFSLQATCHLSSMSFRAQDVTVHADAVQKQCILRVGADQEDRNGSLSLKNPVMGPLSRVATQQDPHPAIH